MGISEEEHRKEGYLDEPEAISDELRPIEDDAVNEELAKVYDAVRLEKSMGGGKEAASKKKSDSESDISSVTEPSTDSELYNISDSEEMTKAMVKRKQEKRARRMAQKRRERKKDY